MRLRPPRLTFILLLFCLSSLSVAAQLPERLVIEPEGWAPSPAGSPGVLAGNTLYLSAQTGQEAGALPSDFAAEARNCFRRLGDILEAAGMGLSDVVSAYVFLTDMGHYQAMNEVFREVFPTRPPVRSTIGVGGLPGSARILVQATAVQSGTRRDYIDPPAGWESGWWPFSAAIRVNGLVYLSGMGTEIMQSGKQEETFKLQLRRGLLNLGELLERAGLDYRHLVYVNPNVVGVSDWTSLNVVYRQFFSYGRAPARATQNVRSLPLGSPAEFSAVALVDLEQRQVVHQVSHPVLPTASPGILAGRVLYTSAFRGFMPGGGGSTSGLPFEPAAPDLATQARYSLRNLQDCLEAAGMTLDNLVSVTAYLNDIENLPQVQAFLREVFHHRPPAITVIQPASKDPAAKSHIQLAGVAVAPGR